MWSSDAIQVEIEEADGSTAVVIVCTPVGTLQMIAELELADACCGRGTPMCRAYGPAPSAAPG